MTTNGHTKTEDAAYQQAKATVRPNWLKDKMQAGGMGYSFGITMTHSAEVVHLAKLAGYTAILLNMEHQRADIGVAADMCIAALNLGISPICVVPASESTWVSRMLDNGAQGIICPRVPDAATARKMVELSKYRPVGKRPLCNTPQAQYSMTNYRAIMDVLNENTLTIPMIESLEGLENCEEIARVPGVDMLFVGTWDLSEELGVIGEYDNPILLNALDRICKAAEAVGIKVGFGGLEWRLDLLGKLRKEHSCVGYVMAGRDLGVLQTGMAAMCQRMEECQ